MNFNVEREPARECELALESVSARWNFRIKLGLERSQVRVLEYELTDRVAY